MTSKPSHSMRDQGQTRRTGEPEPLVRCSLAGDLDERVSHLEESVAQTVRARDGEARRKAEQRERDLAEGWRQHNVKAPNNSAARSLLSRVASEITSDRKRDAVSASLDDPELVLMAQQYKRLLRLVALGGGLDHVEDTGMVLKQAHLFVLSRVADLHPLIERELNRARGEIPESPSPP